MKIRMWKAKKVFLLFFILNRSLVNCEYFSIVGPKTLRIDRPYEVAVTSHSLNTSTTEIMLSIEGTSFIGKKFKATENVEVGAGETKIAEIEARMFELFFRAFLRFFYSFII